MRNLKPWVGLVVSVVLVGGAWARPVQATPNHAQPRGPYSLSASPTDHMPVMQPVQVKRPQPLKIKAPKRPKGELPKGAPEPLGNSTILSTGGPDGYGYQWIDSNEPGWTPPAYLDPPTTFTDVGDDDYVEVTLPFDFLFYGTLYNTIYICSNGYAAFGGGDYTDFSNEPIPDTSSSEPNNALYVYWDDMRPPSGGHIDTATYVVDGKRVFVIEWDSIPRFYDAGAYTFEIQLYEDGDSMAFLYQSVVGYDASYDSAASATIGIENADGTDGLQYSYNTKSVGDGDVILFYRMPVSDDVGVVSIDEPADIVGVGATIEPKATVQNFGTSTATFTTYCEILDTSGAVLYTSNRSVLALPPGDQTQVTFDAWTASARGMYNIRVYTTLSSDQVPGNDTLEGSFQAYNIGTDYLVLDLDPDPSSGIFIHEVLQDSGYAGYYTTDPTALEASNLDSFSTVWITLGIFSYNYELSRAQVEELQTYLLNGGRAYVEGGDCWGYDASRSLLDSLFGIDYANTGDGSSDLDTIIGQTNIFLPNITEQDTWFYGGPNSWIDRLAIDPVPPFGGRADGVLYNPIGEYYTGVAYSNLTYNAFAMSHEISGDTVGTTRSVQNARKLVGEIMRFLSGPTYHVHDLAVDAILQPDCSTLPPGASVPIQIVVKNTGAFTESSYTLRVWVTDPTGTATYYSNVQSISDPLDPGEADTLDLAPWTVPTTQADMVMYAWIVLSSDANPNNDTVAQNYYNYHRHATYACSYYGPYNLSDGYWMADMAYDPFRKVMYVVDVDASDRGIVVVDADPSSATFGDSVGYIPAAGWSTTQRGIAYDPGHDYILVGGWYDDAIYVVDASTYTLVSTWNIGLSIAGLAWDDDRDLLWVIAQDNPDRLYLVDPYAQSILADIAVAWGGFSDGYSSAGLAYLGQGLLLAPNQDAYTLEVLRGCTGEPMLYGEIEGPLTGAWGVGYIDGTDYAWVTSPWDDPSVLYQVWVQIPAAPGDANGDHMFTPEDLAAISDYLYHSGPTPAGNPDTNDDGVVDALDIEALANYLFMNGPFPGCP